MFFKNSRIILIVTLFITVAAIYFASGLRFNYNFESYFPADDPALDYYNEFRERFEDDSRFILIGLQNKEGIFNRNFLLKADSLTKILKKLPGVDQVTSPTSVREPLISSFGIVQVPLIHINNPDRYSSDSAKIYHPQQFFSSFFPPGGRDMIIMVSLKEDLPENTTDQFLDTLSSSVAAFDFDNTFISGKIKVQAAYVKKMQEELIVFLSASIVLISIFLTIAYRSFYGIVIPVLTVILAIIWTLGLMGMTGQPLDLMTTLLPPILFIVGMSDVVHLLTRYLSELNSGKSKPEALKTAYKEIGTATFITSLTTAIGFATLINSNVTPVQSFGIYTCAGVFIAFILAFTFFPAVLVRFKGSIFAPEFAQTSFWNKSLHSLFLRVLKSRRSILAFAIVITIAATFFTTQISLNSTLLDDIGENDPIKADYQYFQENFGGVRAVEIGFQVPDSLSVLEKPVIKEVSKIENYLDSAYGASYIVSPATYIKMLNKALHGGDPDEFRVPDTEREWQQVNKYLPYLKKREQTGAYAKEHYGRISGKINDLGNLEVKAMNDKLNRFINTQADTTLIDYRLTGSALLIDKNNYNLSKNLIRNLCFALLLVGIIMGIIFRSWKMAAIALIPNIIPLLMVSGTMGLFDINLKPSTSIIFSIAFGIAVDDSIHFLSRFRLQLLSGRSFLYALKRTFLGTGKAMVITSLILVSGFLSLVLSSFEGTYYTGLLVSLTLLFALAGDLLVLPVVLILLRKKLFKKRKKQ